MTSKRYQGGCLKLPHICPSYRMVTCEQLSTVPLVQVTWVFLLGNTCSNHWDVKAMFLTLKSSHTLHKSRQYHIHCYTWISDISNKDVLIMYYWKNTNSLQPLPWARVGEELRWLNVNTSMLFLKVTISIFPSGYSWSSFIHPFHFVFKI